MDPATPQTELIAFVKRWQNAGGSERANYQLFLTDLCKVLGVDQPQPAVSCCDALLH